MKAGGSLLRPGILPLLPASMVFPPLKSYLPIFYPRILELSTLTAGKPQSKIYTVRLPLLRVIVPCRARPWPPLLRGGCQIADFRQFDRGSSEPSPGPCVLLHSTMQKHPVFARAVRPVAISRSAVGSPNISCRRTFCREIAASLRSSQ